MFFLLWLLCANVVCAQTVKEVWKTMPDSLLSTLDRNKRLELLDFFDMNVKEAVENRLNGKTVLDTLTESYMKIRLSDCSEVELKLFANRDDSSSDAADSVICMINTISAPQSESRVRIFTFDWALRCDTCFTSKTLILQPDTMSEAAFSDLLKQIPLVLWKAEAPIGESGADELLLTPSFPLTFVEKQEEWAPLILQRKIKLKDILLK